MTMENVAKALTIFTFVTLCWVAHRALQVRSDCISSSYLSLVLIDQEKLYNCGFESRLNLKSLYAPMDYQTLSNVRHMESVEELYSFLPTAGPKLVVEVVHRGDNGGDNKLLELGKGFVRIGYGWLNEPEQLRRFLLMGVLNNEIPQAFASRFELEVVTDFLTLILFPSGAWVHAPVQNLKFSTASASQGFGPVLALALAKVYSKVSLKEKITAMNRLRSVNALPLLFEPLDTKGPALAAWFERSLKELSAALGIDNEMALKQTLKQMEVEAPTHWELTVDITKTPVWREILQQLKKRSEFRPKERILVFTPEGTLALPSGLPVEWAAADISSQKHVMIACNWPRPDEAVQIHARQVYAQQSCEKLTRPFWD